MVETCWKSLSGILVFLATIAMTWEARLPSGIVTTVCSMFFGLVRSAQARLACMWLLSRK